MKELKVPSQTVRSDNDPSRGSQTSIAPTLIQDESMMLVDQAIVAIGKSDLKLTHDNSAIESKEQSAQFPSTHDKSSDLSFFGAEGQDQSAPKRLLNERS